jgi:hypothetical protein
MSARSEGHRDCHQCPGEDFRQLIGYVMPDDDRYRITQMGEHLSGLGTLITWTVGEYFDFSGTPTLGELRKMCSVTIAS